MLFTPHPEVQRVKRQYAVLDGQDIRESNRAGGKELKKILFHCDRQTMHTPLADLDAPDTFFPPPPPPNVPDTADANSFDNADDNDSQPPPPPPPPFVPPPAPDGDDNDATDGGKDSSGAHDGGGGGKGSGTADSKTFTCGQRSKS